MLHVGVHASRPTRDIRDGDSRGYRKFGKATPESGQGYPKDMDKGDALAFVKRLSDRGQTPVQDIGATCLWACHTALYKFADDRDVAGAEQLLAKMHSNGIPITRTTLNIMIRTCAKDGDGPGAEHWLEEVLKKDFVPTVTSYCGVILAWAKAGRLDKVELWIARLSDAGICPPKKICRPVVRILMASIPEGSSQIPTADVATAWLHHAHGLGVPLDRRTINLMMATYARAGNVEKTEQWALFMQRTEITPNSTTLSALVTASRTAGNQERASMWMERMAQLGFEPIDLESQQERYTEAFNSFSSEMYDHDDSDEETVTPPNTMSLGPACRENSVLSSPGVFTHSNNQTSPMAFDGQPRSMHSSDILPKDMTKQFRGMQHRIQRPAPTSGTDKGMLGCSEKAATSPAVRMMRTPKSQQAAVPSPHGMVNPAARMQLPQASLSTIVASYELPLGLPAQDSPSATGPSGLQLYRRLQPACSRKGTTPTPVVAY